MTLFYGKTLKIQQPEEGFKMSIDAMLLSACIQEGETILDVGCGVGTASFCVAKRREVESITGIDCQEENVAYAKENAQNNGSKCQFICGNIKTYKFEKSFDHVMSNPPFFEAHKINFPKNEHKSLSNVLHDITLEEWLSFCIKNAKTWVTIIHLPEYLDQILTQFSKQLGGIKVYPLWSKNKAKRVIVQGKKNSKAPLILHQGLILQNEKGYTQEAEAILNYGEGIRL